VIWAGAWILSGTLFVFGPESLWPGQFPLTVAAALISLGVGIDTLFHWRDMLDNADDLHRKVLLEAMAIALGVGVVIGTLYPAMEDYELVPCASKTSSSTSPSRVSRSTRPRRIAARSVDRQAEHAIDGLNNMFQAAT
jgi:hypothetical protein